jgi:hypothetical protein
MQPYQWPDQYRPQPTREPVPQQPQTPAVVVVLLSLTLVLLVINLGFTIYVFGVAHGVVQLGEEIKSYFGG